jgi:hypothetical protein
MLAKVVSDDHRDWVHHLPSIAFAYNTTLQKSTGFTPHRLIFGCEARLPLDLEWGLGPQTRTYASYDSYVDNQTATQMTDFQFVRENLRQSAAYRKRHYDSTLRYAENIKLNDKVWYFCPRKFKNRCPKWQRMFTGPYEVTRVIDSHNFVIRKSSKTKPLIVHRDKLKLYCSSPTVPMVPADASPLPSATVDVTQSQQSLPLIDHRPSPQPVNDTGRPKRSIRTPARYLNYCCRY